jgi:hypothetical protein
VPVSGLFERKKGKDETVVFGGTCTDGAHPEPEFFQGSDPGKKRTSFSGFGRKPEVN